MIKKRKMSKWTIIWFACCIFLVAPKHVQASEYQSNGTIELVESDQVKNSSDTAKEETPANKGKLPSTGSEHSRLLFLNGVALLFLVIMLEINKRWRRRADEAE
ncbi:MULTISPECIES: hypothetical protein [unclassified Enterococcus]|uniref:hypothetical protein n=1 Tax=unclassified Enterococcus TaxID=2608891 RepID=UPI001CE11CC7|nr:MULTISPECIES: hypothetical protein [unclassified Enterococcus]MCA5013470.1 hypothetical protein [Enterococcus sp. S23]MCA5016720.1 hypothetical protein [Enterococcus sp. S22(2020)]